MNFLFKNLFRLSTDITIVKKSEDMIKLSKWMSDKSICSLSQAKEFIKLGLVRIDGKRVYQNMLIPIDSNMRAFTPLGVKTEKPITKLWKINKPREYICTHNDPQKRRTIYSLLPPDLSQYGYLMSVGRLDYLSQGLLLITNDVTLKNLLENPDANLMRFYRVKVHGRVTPQKIQKMNKPMIIKGQQYGPLNANIDRQLSTNVWLNISLRRGKNRQIRRILQKCDLQIGKLIRQSYGPYKLGALKHGDVVEIPISAGLDRKLKITKAKNLIKSEGGKISLVEVDIREKAIQIATKQKQKRNSLPEQKINQFLTNKPNAQELETVEDEDE